MSESEAPTPELSPPPEPQLREKLAHLRARYTLAAQQQLALRAQQQALAEQERQVAAAMGPLLGAIMALEELAG